MDVDKASLTLEEYNGLSQTHPHQLLEHAQSFQLSTEQVRALSIRFLRGHFVLSRQMRERELGYVLEYISSKGSRPSADVTVLSDLLHPELTRLLFQKYIYENNPERFALWERNEALRGQLDSHFLLCLSLMGSNENLNRDWLLSALAAATYRHLVRADVGNQPIMRGFFPYCTGKTFFCEPHVGRPHQDGNYWCRRHPCRSPRTIPNLLKPWFEYCAHDWLGSVGLAESDNPSGFPAQLASWYNRVNEIRPNLYCEACHEVMVPDLKYSRETVAVPGSGTTAVEVVHTQGTAYRATVFHCDTRTCYCKDEGIYLNHCWNRKCLSIIDSRVAHKCATCNWYICPMCDECAETCSRQR
jgi:hypothetical protein